MKKSTHLLLTVLAAAALQACSSLAADNLALESAKREYGAAQDNPVVVSLAPSELKQAELSLKSAQDAWLRNGSPSEVNHLSYLARQDIAIAQEAARQKTAEADVESAEKSRNRTLLVARTNEADEALRSAETARRQAQMAVRDSELANQKTREAEQYAGQLQAKLNDLNAKSTDRGYVVTIGDILFDTNRSELKAGATSSVEMLGEFLRQYPQRNVVVEGYTDNIGSQDSNLDLSARRANAVRMALVGMGISGTRISAKGYGEGYPVAANQSADGRQLNRRVEVVLSDETGKVIAR